MTHHEQWGANPDMPSIEQIEEYRDLMVGIVREQGRGIRVGRPGDRARTRVGTEYMLPGAHTEWSIPDKKFRTKILRERRYSASYRASVGEAASRLIVLESDSVRVDDSFKTRRNLYRFGWHELMGVYEAEVLPVEIVCDARTDMELIETDFGLRATAMFDHERTIESLDDDKTAGYMRSINPMRDTESPWQAVTEVEFDGLLFRTGEFSRDLLDELNDRELAS